MWSLPQACEKWGKRFQKHELLAPIIGGRQDVLLHVAFQSNGLEEVSSFPVFTNLYKLLYLRTKLDSHLIISRVTRVTMDVEQEKENSSDETTHLKGLGSALCEIACSFHVSRLGRLDFSHQQSCESQAGQSSPRLQKNAENLEWYRVNSANSLSVQQNSETTSKQHNLLL